ncbi:MAG: Si-specific NAD(P)(+) transhydrogenase [Pseudomonadota bacterium]
MKSIVKHYDSIVIGSGPAGEGAAMTLRKAGQEVAVLEKHFDVGGGCVHWGTIPSKALRHSVQLLADYRSRPLFQKLGYLDISYHELLASAGSVVGEQVALRRSFYQRNRVDVLTGTATFTDRHTLELLQPSGGLMTLHAEHFVIATGSRPYQPPDVDFSHRRVCDSDTVLSPEVPEPRSIIIYGAGVIGCEYASFFAELGLKVNLVNTQDRLLSFLDSEITDALGYHLRDQGVTIRSNEEYSGVDAQADYVRLHCKSGKQFKADLLLWANGRAGNTQELGLEEIGVETNYRGQIVVDDHLRSVGESHIFAAGDVVGPPGLASASYDQGRYVGSHILNPAIDTALIKDIPNGIYTSPEISSVGRTEAELTEACIPYEVGRATFRSIARAQITGRQVGMLKILFHTETLEILGIHCFGSQAAEIVHIGQAVMLQKHGGNSVEYFTDTTFNYPTMAEAYRVAALNGLNRLS